MYKYEHISKIHCYFREKKAQKNVHIFLNGGRPRIYEQMFIFVCIYIQRSFRRIRKKFIKMAMKVMGSIRYLISLNLSLLICGLANFEN